MCPFNRERLLEQCKLFLGHRGLEGPVRVRSRSDHLESQAEECGLILLQGHKYFRKATWPEVEAALKQGEPRTPGEARQLPATREKALGQG